MGKREDESADDISETRKRFLGNEENEDLKSTEEDEEEDSDKEKESRFSKAVGRCTSFFKKHWDNTIGEIEGDWVFLTLLGVIMAWISLFVEATIYVCTSSQLYLFRDLISSPILKYFGWICIPCCLMVFSTAFTRLFAPQVAGSGIPELKTTMGLITMKELFTFKAFITKIIALSTTLGTGLPIGREGPFVHIASMLAVVLNKFTSDLKGETVNRSRNIDVMAAGCAVGVAAAFSAPVGGVLFSIEVTSYHFAVRNYWRSFYAAVCGTVTHRLLAVWYRGDASFIALFKTDITPEVPYAMQELIGFIILGIVSGLLGALFVWTHRAYITFRDTNFIIKAINNKSFLLYPFLVTLVYTTCTFPLGTGMFIAGERTIEEQVADSFVNFTWQKTDPTIREFRIISYWTSAYTGIYVNLVTYLIFTFFASIACISLPVPAGLFIPVFKYGALIGRLFGELMVTIFPEGFSEGMIDTMIIPGAYSIVGAASFAGAATHTISTAVIAFELTGQITFAIPIMVGVLIANAICQVLQPSIFDSIIKMRKLPYLPAIPTTSSKSYQVFVEDFMDRNFRFIWHGITFDELKIVLLLNKKIVDFPLVDSADSMILLGSANRYDLIGLIKENVGDKKKLPYFDEWKTEAEKILEKELLEEQEKQQEMLENQTEIINEKDPEKNKHASFRKYSSEQNISKSLNIALDRFNQDKVASQQLAPRKSITGSLDTLKSVTQPLTIPAIDIQYIDAGSLDEKHGESPSFPTSERRPSRFSVTKVGGSDSSSLQDERDLVDKEDGKERDESLAGPSVPISASPFDFNESIAKTLDTVEVEEESKFPKKSILKKTQSFVFEPHTHEIDESELDNKRNYVTIHGDAANFKGVKQSLAVFLKAKSLLLNENKISPITLTVSRADINTNRLIEMIREMELSWEEEQMKIRVDFKKCIINPAPHQLVERTNLLQVHSIFSMLGLSQSYVTAIGRIIGVVSITELKTVIDKMNSGELKSIAQSGTKTRRFSLNFLSSSR